jgi:hypothetical protein
MTSRVLAESAASDAPVAVLLPGVGYTIQGPLLYWCAELLASRGWHVQGAEWSVDSAAAADPVPFVEHAVAEAFDAAPRSSRRLIVAKSFGSFALPWALREGIPGVWLTPVLASDIVRDALRDASESHLAIGGDADALWRPEDMAATRASLVTVPGAGHSLTLAGNWRGSLALQSEVLETVATHLDTL